MKAKSEPVDKAKARTTARHARGSGESVVSPANEPWPREQMIAKAAYFLAERRGFAPGNEMSDWLQAEADVDRAPSSGR